MIMRKVLIFALTIAIALGGIAFAHAAVTESQDDLLIYPTLEVGDKSILDGLSAEMTFNCGDHLLWHSTYTFGGGTQTDFVYNAEGFPREESSGYNRMELYLSGGASASTSGQFHLGNQGYGALFHAVAEQTENGSEKTMELKMSDYVDYYQLDFEISYQEQNRQCHLSCNAIGALEGRDWYNDNSIYSTFLDRFRFPVQEDQTVSVSIYKNDAGQISSFEFYPNEGPEVSFIDYVGTEGIWFIPIFRDFNGNPLPYESPEGHGLYFVPWKVTEVYDIREYVVPDMEKLQLVVPLDETLPVDHIVIDGAQKELRMLSREEGRYVLSAWDLTTGTETSRLDLFAQDPAQASFGSFDHIGSYLLVTVQDRLALVDPAADKVLLTAPDVSGQRYRADSFNSDLGALRFDGERLYLLSAAYSYHDGTFWTAVWQEGELLYYGEYDCSLMRGNEDWYYRSVDVESFPMMWK